MQESAALVPINSLVLATESGAVVRPFSERGDGGSPYGDPLVTGWEASRCERSLK